MLLGCEKYCVYAGRLNEYEEDEVWVYETNSSEKAKEVVDKIISINTPPVWAYAFTTNTGEELVMQSKK